MCRCVLKTLNIFRQTENTLSMFIPVPFVPRSCSCWAEWRRQSSSPSGLMRKKRHTCKQGSLAWQLQLSTSCSRIPINIWSQQSGPNYLWDFIFCPLSCHMSYSFLQWGLPVVRTPERHSLPTAHRLQASGSCRCNTQQHHWICCG